VAENFPFGTLDDITRSAFYLFQPCLAHDVVMLPDLCNQYIRLMAAKMIYVVRSPNGLCGTSFRTKTGDGMTLEFLQQTWVLVLYAADHT
jgi:hypothetical protein